MPSGGKREGAGRPKGSPNKSTQEIRNAFQMFVENNVENFEDWIVRVAETNPAKAIELVTNLGEYILPKLSRTEVKAEITTDEIDLSNLPQETLDKLINENDTNETESGEL
jgi:hypothetical protein